MDRVDHPLTDHSFLRSRRSVRRFLPDPVPRECLERILETAAWAPSAHNRQPWRFAVVINPEAKTRLAEEMRIEFERDLSSDGLSQAEIEGRVARSKNRILQAPVIIVLCLDVQDMDDYPDPRRSQAETIMGIQSVALAGGTMLLAAYSEGLGGVWMCAPLFAPEAVRRALNLSLSWQPQGMLALGYPAENPEPRIRRNLEEITVFY